MYTQHAMTRCQQRSLTPEIVDTILAYGERMRHHGADVYFMDGRCRARAASAVGTRQFRKIERRLNSYVVVSDDGRVITAARRIKRLKF
jgi:hypothetical protein